MRGNLQEHDLGCRNVNASVADRSKADEALNNNSDRSLKVQDQQAQQGFQEQGFDCLAQAQCPRLAPNVFKVPVTSAGRIMQSACALLMISFLFPPQQLDNTACQAAEGVTPTSTLSAWCPSDTISNVLEGSGSAAPADVELQQQVLKNITAHPLTSICEDWENDATLAVTCQVILHPADLFS